MRVVHKYDCTELPSRPTFEDTQAQYVNLVLLSMWLGQELRSQVQCEVAHEKTWAVQPKLPEFVAFGG
jgi:hypothetical protein